MRRDPPAGRLRRLLAHERWPFAAAVLGVTLGLPALWGGAGIDDHAHRARLEGVIPTENVYLEFFAFMPGPGEGNEQLWQDGILPWWTHPELKAAFLRPVSVATHVVDHHLWPDIYPLQHAHSLLWYGLAVWIVALLYRRIGGAGAAAGLAALLFAVEDCHAFPAAWLANRNALVALVFGGLALLLHVRWRQEGGRARLPLALFCLALALLSAEAGLGAAAYVVAYELTLVRKPWKNKALALLPYVALVVAWRVVYTAMGFGAQGSSLYVDPGRDPLAFLGAVAERVPVLIFSQWTQFATDIWLFLPRPLQLGLVVAGVFVTAAMTAFFLPQLRARPEARFWALGMLLALIPVSAAFPMDRLLLFSGIGAFGLLAGQAEMLGWTGACARTKAGRRGGLEPSRPRSAIERSVERSGAWLVETQRPKPAVVSCDQGGLGARASLPAEKTARRLGQQTFGRQGPAPASSAGPRAAKFGAVGEPGERPQDKRVAARPPFCQRAVRALTGVLLALHAVAALGLFPLRVMSSRILCDSANEAVRQAPDDEAVPNQTFVFVNGLELATTYIPLVRNLDSGRVPRRLALLASFLATNEVHRIDARTLAITPEQGFLARDGERLFRSLDRPFEPGETIRTEDFEVTVTTVTEDGRPAAARFQFDLPLEDPTLRWLHWKQGELQAFPLPAVGETVTVPRSLPAMVVGGRLVRVDR